jgi:hypothetical protein
MFPPLSPTTPLSPLPKEYARIDKLSAAGAAPGVAVQDVKTKVLRQAPLNLVHDVDLTYPGLRLVHLDPPVFVIEDFLSAEECDRYIALADADEEGKECPRAMKVDSPTFGLALNAARTSTTWFCRYDALREMVERNAKLLKLDETTEARQRFEEPQLVRYEPGQQFKWHFDEVPEEQQAVEGSGGQRLATTLVYLNNLEDDAGQAGATVFRDMGVSVVPKKGMGLLFFPSFAGDGIVGGGSDAEDEGAAGEEATDAKKKKKKPKAKKQKSKKNKGPAFTPMDVTRGMGDARTLHAGFAPLSGTKWISQIWTHEREYAPRVPQGNAHLGDCT